MSARPPLQNSFDFGPIDPSAVKGRAVTPRQNLVIEAGAGTGKTTAIVAEVLALLLADETLKPERVVLMTFSEKAAGEIAGRIHEALSDLSFHFDDPEVVWPVGSPTPLFRVPPAEVASYRRACATQLARVESIRSQTIHSFCQSLLRAHPIEAGLDPQFRIVEGFERSLLYERLYDDWVDLETRVRPRPEDLADWETTIEHFQYFSQARDAIFSLIERRDLLARPARELGSVVEVKGLLREIIEEAKGIIEPVDTLTDEHARRLFTYIRSNEPPPPQASLDAWIEWLDPMAEDLLAANVPRKGTNHEKFGDALKRLRNNDDKKGDSVHAQLVSHRAAVALFNLGKRFVSFLDDQKRKLGVVDFDDLLLRTDALLENREVIHRIRAQYDHIFVDECQDTDRLQARIIDRLSRDAGDNIVPGRMVIVGDPKQSIYGFRRADPETYRSMVETLEDAGARAQALVEQYRSEPSLVDAINAIFSRTFARRGESDPNVFRPEYFALRAAATDSALRRGEGTQPPDAPLTLLHATHADKADRHLNEAAAIAEWIKARRNGAVRDLSRFAILFRRFTEIDDYLATFDRYGIRYVLPPSRAFLERPVAVDIVTVLRAIGSRFDRGAEISAARTPCFGLTDDEIARGLLEPDAAAPYGQMVALLEQWHRDAPHRSVVQTIDAIIGTCGLREGYEHTFDGPRLLLHLENVRRIAFEYDQRQGGSVAQFVEEIARRRADPDELEPSTINEGDDAVRIMTVHGAKGLEFDTVILADVGFRTQNRDMVQLFTTEEPAGLVMRGRTKSISGNFRHTPTGEKLSAIGGLRDQAELDRLFYVAVTRARHEVVIACNTKTLAAHSFWGCLAEVFGFVAKTADQLWPDEGRQIRSFDLDGRQVKIAFERVVPGAAASAARPRLSDPELQRIVADAPLSSIILPTPTSSVERLPAAQAASLRQSGRKREAGIALHRALELWDFEMATAETALAWAVAEQGVDAATEELLRKRMTTIASSPLVARLRTAETIGRELPLHWIDESGALIERRLDRLLREGSEYLVVDYKSGDATEERLLQDRQQIADYCRAVTAMSGQPCRGLLWYIGERQSIVENGQLTIEI